MCEFCQIFHLTKKIILSPVTDRAAESHFDLASLQRRRTRENEEEKGEEKKGEDREGAVR